MSDFRRRLMMRQKVKKVSEPFAYEGSAYTCFLDSSKPVSLSSGVSSGDHSTFIHICGKNIYNPDSNILSTKNQGEPCAYGDQSMFAFGQPMVLSFDTPNTGIEVSLNTAELGIDNSHKVIFDGTRKKIIFTPTKTLAGRISLLIRESPTSSIESGKISNVQLELALNETPYETYSGIVHRIGSIHPRTVSGTINWMSGSFGVSVNGAFITGEKSVFPKVEFTEDSVITLIPYGNEPLNLNVSGYKYK